MTAARLATPPQGDLELARLCALKDPAALRQAVTANNQRLFRAAWSILKDRSEAGRGLAGHVTYGLLVPRDGGGAEPGRRLRRGDLAAAAPSAGRAAGRADRRDAVPG